MEKNTEMVITSVPAEIRTIAQSLPELLGKEAAVVF
jgi:hypothetical protein